MIGFTRSFLSCLYLLSITSCIEAVVLCGNEHAPIPGHLIRTHERLAAQESQNFTRNSTSLRKRDALYLDLYIHVVQAENASNTVTEAQVSTQANTIINRFSPYGIYFNYKGYDRTINSSWAVNTEPLAMKRALRKGGYDAANLYVIDQVYEPLLNGTVFGYATFPYELADIPFNLPPDEVYQGSPTTYQALDGTVVTKLTLTNATNFFIQGSGTVAVHELGHWFGLFHTFMGNNCSGPGDYISDTRVESRPTRGCPIGKNSCPQVDVPGDDPIHNYMDYSGESCLTEFTPLQIKRVKNLFEIYRRPVDTASTTQVAAATSTSLPISASTSFGPNAPSEAGAPSSSLSTSTMIQSSANADRGGPATLTSAPDASCVVTISIPTCPLAIALPTAF